MSHNSLFCFLLVMSIIVKPLLNCGKLITITKCRVSKKLSFDSPTCSKNILSSSFKSTVEMKKIQKNMNINYRKFRRYRKSTFLMSPPWAKAVNIWKYFLSVFLRLHSSLNYYV